MKVSTAHGHTLRRIAAFRHSLLEASGRLRKHLNTDPVEEGGYDMRAPRRKRKLFGVVTLVGEKGESSVLPSAEGRRQPYCMLALIEYLRRLVRRVCDCSWVDKM